MKTIRDAEVMKIVQGALASSSRVAASLCLVLALGGMYDEATAR